MKFNNSVIAFLSQLAAAKNFAAAKTTHVNGSSSLRKQHGMGAGKNMKTLDREVQTAPTDFIKDHHADAGYAKVGVISHERSYEGLEDTGNAKATRSGATHHGSSSTYAASVVKKEIETTPTDFIKDQSAKVGVISQERSYEGSEDTRKKIDTNLLLATKTLKLITDVTLDNYNHDIGQACFHKIASLEGDTTLTDLGLGLRTVCNNDGSVVVTAGILLETNDAQDDTFKYVVKIFGDGSNGELDPTSVHTIIEEGEGSLFERDAHVEIALSGDGKTLAIANTKAYRGGYYFEALQVSLDSVGSKLVVGLPYVDASLDGKAIPNVGNVQIYDLTSDSPSTPFYDLALNGFYLGAVISGGAYIGRKVAISGDGTSFIFSAPGDNKVYWSQVGSSSTLVSFSGEQDDSDMGSSLTITSDGTIFAYGARNHDDIDAVDKGIVTVQRKTDSTEVPWQRLGQVLMGEQGEGINGGSYYVGDIFGYDIALSEKDAYNPNHASSIIRLLVGSPLNDVTGLNDESYYQGQGELFQINYKDATQDTLWEQVAYDVDGQTSKEESGRSVAMSARGDTIIIGAPGYEPSSKGGYFEGIVRVYKQTEYSSVPSSVPSDIPSLTLMPSANPSVSSEPSSQPSLSLEPSQTPSISAQPSVAPSVSVVPSSTPSAVVDKEFQLISTFAKFGQDKDWCLTAFDNTNLRVRPCGLFDSQLWKFTSAGKITLADRAEGKFCVKTIFRQLSVDTCGDSGDVSIINFAYKDGSILHTKNEKTSKVGFNPEKRFERLYRDGTLNEVLDKWVIRYSYEMNITTSPSVSAVPSVSTAPSVSAAPSVSVAPSVLPSVSAVPSVSAAPSIMPLQFNTKDDHACAFYSSEVQCFGYNYYGELGNPKVTSKSSTTPITMLYSNISTSPVKVVTGDGSTCILMDDGSVYCYGKNQSGQLGDGTTTNSRTAVQVVQDSSPLTGVTDIAGQEDLHYCAIYGTDDTIYCWGSTANNLLTWNGTPKAKMIVVFNNFTCVMFAEFSSQVQCRGSDNFNGNSYEMNETITKLTTGNYFFCALLADQTAKCVGSNFFGNLGNGLRIDNYDSASHVLEKANSPLSKITDINAGKTSTCLVADGTPMCFGKNNYYQLGIDSRKGNVLYPTQLDVTFPNGSIPVSVHVALYNGYAVMADNSVYSWGYNTYGALGDGSPLSNIIGNVAGEATRKVAFNW